MDSEPAGVDQQGGGELRSAEDQEVPGALLFQNGYILERLSHHFRPRPRAVAHAAAADDVPLAVDPPGELALTGGEVREVLGDRPVLHEKAKGVPPEQDRVEGVAQAVVELVAAADEAVESARD